MKNRRRIVLALPGLGLLGSLPAFGQAPSQRIGVLWLGSPQTHGHLHEEMRTSLAKLGYVEGRDIAIDVRWSGNRLEALPSLAAELLALKPAVVMTFGSPGVQAMQKATSTVPIVFTSAGDPVGQGFVKSMRRPGGNITGVAFNEEINKKVYEVFRALMPAATRLAILVNVNNIAQKHHLDDVPMMAKQLRFEPQLVHATKEEELEGAFRSAAKGKAQAMVVATVAPFNGLRQQIVALQNKYRLPTFHGAREALLAGAVGSYSFPFEQNMRRGAAIIGQILKGANPAEIPVELPTLYEIGVNLKAAAGLGLTVPQDLLLRADLVIR